MDTRLMKPEFPLMRRFNRDLESLFNRFGFGFFDRPLVESAEIAWSPDIELFEKGDELFVRADLPGMKRDEINVEITDSELTIRGERKLEREQKEEGFYRSERTYGSFLRTVVLPEGVKAADAKAIMKDGVLEIRMPMTKIEPAKRRLTISEEPTEKAKHAA